MKKITKILSVVLILAMLFSFAACNKNEAEEKTDKDNEKVTQEELFNAENYIGEWGADYYGAGIYGETITILSADDNCINCDIFYYRIAGFDNIEATVNGDGVADIRATCDEQLYLNGKMIFEKNQIKLIVEETNVNSIESQTLVFERIKNALEIQESIDRAFLFGYNSYKAY